MTADKMSPEMQATLLQDCLESLEQAHKLIVDAIEGRPLNAFRLENYIYDTKYMLRDAELEGFLISSGIDHLLGNEE